MVCVIIAIVKAYSAFFEEKTPNFLPKKLRTLFLNFFLLLFLTVVIHSSDVDGTCSWLTSALAISEN